jgi:hypothetical protein
VVCAKEKKRRLETGQGIEGRRKSSKNAVAEFRRP